MAKYLITGASGFIGSNFVNYVKRVEPNSEVIGIGREHDLTDLDVCMSMLRDSGCLDYIFHFADVSGNAEWSKRHSADQFLANARISINMLEAIKTVQSTAHLIGFSSAWAYPANHRNLSEEHYWDGPMLKSIQHYGLTKKVFGGGLQSYKQQYDMTGSVLVLGSVYGPGDKSDHLIPSLISRMSSDKTRLEIRGDGNQIRDFIYISDQLEAIYVHRDSNLDLLNISGGQTFTVREVVDCLADLMAYKGDIIYEINSTPSDDVRILDMSRATETTGWPRNYRLITLREGLALTLDKEI
jgi:nucleoside-diphosphate-sugar epimerase